MARAPEKQGSGILAFFTDTLKTLGSAERMGDQHGATDPILYKWKDVATFDASHDLIVKSRTRTRNIQSDTRTSAQIQKEAAQIFACCDTYIQSHQLGIGVLHGLKKARIDELKKAGQSAEMADELTLDANEQAEFVTLQLTLAEQYRVIESMYIHLSDSMESTGIKST